MARPPEATNPVAGSDRSPRASLALRRGPGYLDRVVRMLEEQAATGDPVALDALSWIRAVRAQRTRCLEERCARSAAHSLVCPRRRIWS